MNNMNWDSAIKIRSNMLALSLERTNQALPTKKNEADQKLKNLIRRLDQEDRKVLNDVLKGKTIKQESLERLSGNLTKFSKIDQDKPANKKKLVRHALRNLFWGRVGSEKLFTAAQKLDSDAVYNARLDEWEKEKPAGKEPKAEKSKEPKARNPAKEERKTEKPLKKETIGATAAKLADKSVKPKATKIEGHKWEVKETDKKALTHLFGDLDQIPVYTKVIDGNDILEQNSTLIGDIKNPITRGYIEGKGSCIILKVKGRLEPKDKDLPSKKEVKDPSAKKTILDESSEEEIKSKPILVTRLLVFHDNPPSETNSHGGWSQAKTNASYSPRIFNYNEVFTDAKGEFKTIDVEGKAKPLYKEEINVIRRLVSSKSAKEAPFIAVKNPKVKREEWALVQ